MAKTNVNVRKILSFIITLAMVLSLVNLPGAVRASAAAGDTPPHTKNITDNQDGTYTISLDIVGESEKKPNNVNVIVIVDTSGSMTSQRMSAAKNAVSSLANSLYAYNTQSEPDTVEMALVRFATSSSVARTPTNNSTQFLNALNGLPTQGNGGTNWEAALQTANGIDFGDDDQTFAIFVSDGNPTFRVTQNGWNDWSQQYQQWGTGQETTQNIQRCYTTAVDDAQALATKVTPGNFFTIGAFGSVDRMEQLTDDAGSNSDTNYYSAQNTAALNQALADILAKIEMAGFADAEVDDGTTNQVVTSSGSIAELLELVPNFKYYRSGGSYGTMQEWTNAPEAKIVNGEVEWDLSSEGVLENGVKYTVTFDCYPSQTTYDTIAQLKNGDIKYSDLDPEIQKYIVDNGGGSYSLRTNTNAGIKWDDTRDDEGRQESAYTNPDPVKTDAETLTASKEWEGGDPDVDELEITVLMDDEPFHADTISEDNGWSTESFISIGIIKSGQVLPGAEGHDFKFAELGDEQYHWELESPVVHPMLIDGTRTMLIMVDEKHPAPSGAATYSINGKTYYADTSAAGLTAVNHRRSNLNLTKVVTGEDAPADAKFPFELTVNNPKAPTSEPADDPDHESDYWIWLSVRDENGQGVTGLNPGSGVVEDSGGYYYAPNGTTFSLEIGAGWSLRFLNLLSGTTYTFVEGTLPEGFAFNKAELTQGEDSTFSGAQTTTGTIENTKTSYYVTYTNDYALTDLEITKVWSDADNQDGIRLTADELKAKLSLSPEVEGKEPAVVDNGDGTYTITYTGLPRFNNNTEVKYTVTEDKIDGYTTTGNPAEDHGTITNTHEPEVTEVSVTKVWDDNDDEGKIRPTAINVQLYTSADKGETVGDPVALEGDSWTYTWENLPKFKDGTEIEYYADETAVPTGYTKTGVTGDVEAGYTITNKYSPTPVEVDPPVQKVITGKDDLYNKGDFTFTIESTSAPTGVTAPMPEKTSITNIAENELEGKTGFYEFGAIEFTRPGTYVYTVKESGSVDGVTNDPDAETGKTLTFTVTDDGTGKLTVSPTTDQVQLSFTNTYNADGEATITVTKAVEGAEWPEGKTLTFTFSGEGGTLPETKTQTLTAPGSVSFGPIKYDLADAGKTYTYTISEDGFGAGWNGSGDITATVEVTDNGDGTLSTAITYEPNDAKITNTYEAEGTAKVEVTKALEGAGWPEGKTLTFTLAGTGSAPTPVENKVTLTEEGTVAFDEITYTEADAGKTYTYTISEDGFGAGWAGSGVVTATVVVTDNGDGTLSTAVTYSPENKTITNTYKAEGEAVLEVTKDLEGAGWPEGKTLTFTLSGEGGTLPQTKTQTLTAPGTATFGAITYTEADAGKTYTYTISEDGFGAGWTGSGDITATVNVIDNGDGTLKTEVTYSPENKTVTNTYKAEGEAKLEVTKALEGAGWPEGKTLTFTLSGEGGTLPETKTKELTAPGKVTFDAITYDEADAGKTYTYTISEDSFGDGWTGSGDITATVAVTDNGDGTLKTEVTYSPEDATITNTYKAEGEAVLEATKELEGAGWPEGKTLTFTLSGEGGTLPETKEQTLSAAGSVTFDAIKYTEEDIDKEYTYTISEDGFGDGWTGSGDITATVKVTDNGDGTLKTEVTYSPENKKVTNTYKAEGEAVLEVTKDLEGAGWPEGKTLTFTLSGEGGTLPELKEATLDAPGTATFNAIKYTEDDAGKTYTYTISEDGFGAGWTGSGDITATVAVTDNGDGTLKTEITYSPEDATITNTYEAEGEIKLEATKDLKGADWPEGKTLTFTLSGEGGTLPETKEQTLSAAGSVTFDAIKYTEEDIDKEYTYTISEDGFGDGWTGSGDITATVKVTDNGDGTLKTEVTYTPENKTITNTYVAEGTAVLEVTKELEGAGWPEGKTLTFTLSGEGGTMPETKEQTLSAAGRVSFDAITYSEADAGKTYTYTISEDGFGDGWTGSGDITATVVVTDKGDGTLSTAVTYDPEDATITNTYEAEGEIKLEATKDLEGAGWPEGKTLTFTLSGEGGTMPETKEQTLSAAGSVTFDAIKYTEEDIDKEYTYTISEDGFGDGWTGSGDITVTVKVNDNGDGTLEPVATYSPESATITNTYVAEGTATLKAIKVIEGVDWPEGATLTFTLSGEGGTLPETTEKTLTAPGTVTFDAITYSEEDIDKEYTYTISEDGFGDDWTASGDITATVKVTDNGDGTLSTEVTYDPEDVTITNEYTPDETTVTVTKKWDDDSNRDRKRPEELKLTLNGAPSGFKVPDPTITKDGDSWTYTWTGIPKNWNGTEIQYTVTEENVPEGYTCEETTVNAGGTITNSYNIETTSIDVIKEWIDDDNAFNTRPSSIQVQLTADGTAEGDPVTLDESNGWQYTWTGLPKNADGVEIDYSVEEVYVDHYVSSVSKEGKIITVTNSAVLKSVYDNADPETMIDGEVVQVGTELKYEISYTNATGEKADVTITDEIPDFTTFVSADNGGEFADGVVTWNLSAADGETITVSFVVKVDDEANEQTIVNDATVRTGDNDYTTNEVTNPTPGDTPSEPTGEGNLIVKKTLEGRELKEGEFSFTLTPAEGAPGETETVKNDADGNVKFSEIIFRKVGDYQYKISEESGDLGGVTYTDSEFTAIAEVRQDPADKKLLVVTWKIDGREDKTAEFINKYEAKGSIKLQARKELTGTATDLPAGAFTFVLEGDDIETQEKTNAADGTVVFDAIEYTKSGSMDGETEVTKTYTITEKNDGVECYTYDEHEAKVTVTLKDDGEGNIICEAVYDDGDTAVFTNEYNASGSVPVTAMKDLTGRELNEGEFNFTLTQVDKDGNPVEDGTVITAKNDKSGKVDFGMIDYTQDDMVDDGTEADMTEEAGQEDQNDGEGAAQADAAAEETTAEDATVTEEAATEETTAKDATVTEEAAENVVETEEITAEDVAEAKDAVVENDAASNEETTKTTVYTKVTTEDEPTTKVSYIYNDADGNEQTAEDLPEDAEDNGDGTFTVTTTVTETVEIPVTVEVESAAEAVTTEVAAEIETSGTGTTTIEVTKEFKTVYTKVEETIPGEQKVVYVYIDENGEEQTVDELPEGAVDNGDDTFTVTETVSSEPTDEMIEDEAHETSDGEVAANAAEAEEEKKYVTEKTFYYEIVEETGDLGGVKYDDHKEIVKVTVVDNGDGTLTATAEYDEDGASFTNEYTASGSANFEGTKTLKNHDLAEGQFEFTMTPVDGAPGEKQTVKNGGDGSISFNDVEFTQDDAGKTYSYWITEVNSNKKGYIYDSHTAEVTVEITDNGNGTLRCEVTYSDGSKATFENSYKPLSTYLSLEAVKALEGKSLANGEFKFLLSDENGNEIETASNDADGKVAFSDILIDKEGTYTFFVNEIAGNNSNMTYDENTYTYEVTVEDVDGQLTVTAIKADDKDGGETATFFNKYTTPPPPPTPDPDPPKDDKIIPPMGDDSNAMLWILLLGGAAATVGALVILRRRGKNEDGETNA